MKQLTERCGVATPPKVMTPEFANSFVIGGKASKPFKKDSSKISDYDIGCVKCWRCNWARLFERSFGVFQVHKLPLLHFYCWL